ncbi:DUF1007 family protein [Aliiroseovarius sp.]|uniref:DUF1007 family protein n=1 Tax=Aliiroseovarius sp. TaxID=1872442 RepID=UPI003BA92E7D
MRRRISQARRVMRAAMLACGLSAGAAAAHPHVFVDGGIDFLFGPDQMLTALEVTWLYDEFETLYTLSALELSLNAAGGLDEADRLELVRRLSDWPEDFDGSAHLTQGGEAVALAPPRGLDARMVDGRLLLTFTRPLVQPVAVGQSPVEAAFYESTYFFDFTLTNAPRLLGAAPGCAARVTPFDPSAQEAELLQVLARLGREETPETENVGAFFADRITLQCD